MRALPPALLLLLAGSLAAQSVEPVEVADRTIVSMSYVAMLRDGTVFDSTGGEPRDFVIGAGRMLPALENAIKGMKAGDRKLVEISAADGLADGPLAGKDLVVQTDIVSVRAATVAEMKNACD